MIKINRPINIPNKLTIQGVAADKINRDEYDKDPEKYKNVKVEFNILNKIYGHQTVKSVLRNAQFGKCCFCEKDQREEDGAVEHFRPKMGYKDGRKDKLIKPGYFWLGYSWDNLLFCCKKCNGAMCKGNMFPLTKDSTRARNHNDNLALEVPLLIDPAKINPQDHIYFDNEFIKHKTEFGKQTINILKLDRPELTDFRKEHIDHLKKAIIIVKIKKQFSVAVVMEAKKFLINAQKPSAKFSATAKAFIVNSKIDLT